MQNYHFYAEFTDLFCGELNYSFVHRFVIFAKSELGASQMLSRELGLNFRKQYGSADDCAIYHSTSKLSGYTLEFFDNNDASAPCANRHTITLGKNK